MVNRIYFDFYEGVHKELSDKHDFFVRFRTDCEAGEPSIPPYYANGKLSDVINDAINGYDEIAIEIASCEWVRNPSVSIPCQHNVIVIDGVLLVTDTYMDDRLVDYGFKRGDSWIFRRYWNSKSLNYVHWSFKRQMSDEDLVIKVQKSGRELIYNGKEFKIHFGSSLVSNGTTVVLGEKLPYDEKQEIIIPLINEMRHKSLNGIHEDIVQHLMKISEVGETDVRSKP